MKGKSVLAEAFTEAGVDSTFILSFYLKEEKSDSLCKYVLN